MNIIAGNGYFGKKKEKYLESKIALTKQMALLQTTDWKLSNIDTRDTEIFFEISKTLTFWSHEYDSQI